MDKKLLDCEWTILRALWGKKPQGMKDIIASVQKEQPQIKWQYKTYHSYLRTMLEKGLIGCEVLSARDKLYFAAITREQALEYESETLLSRVSRDSMGRLVAMMAEKARISEQDMQELTALFERLKNGEDKKNGG
jgi:BlaI family penicillinase repressor